ncbi:MAG TPA: hypothetical protein VGQ53_04075 [Chitinophagaceae bacterium]|nr:hypothetical protein [Chitinophagaceae bacterium]
MTGTVRTQTDKREGANFARDNCEAIIGTKNFPVNNNEDKGYE